MTAAIIILIVVGLLVGGLMALRNSSKTGMPPPDVLERATRRARELEEHEKTEDSKRS